MWVIAMKKNVRLTQCCLLRRRIKQSLMESLRSLEFFDKTNRSRELSARSSVMRTLADPEGACPTIASLVRLLNLIWWACCRSTRQRALCEH